LKINKYTKRISAGLDRLATNGNASGNNADKYDGSDDDEYYLARGSEPPRFAYYRHVRVEQCIDEWRKKTLECVYDSITQDELDYSLKRKLRIPPEQRYQYNKMNWFFHESSYSMRGFDAYDGKGCNGFTGCIPECRYYPTTGRIEDEEVIHEHKELEDVDRKRNRIVNIDIITDNKD
jgi:hypothetical protein